MKVNNISSTQDQITLEAVRSSAAKLISPKAVLLVTRSGILAHSFPVATTSVEVTINQDLKAITPVEVVDHEYLAWVLRSLERQVLSTCSKHGTTVHSIEMPALKALPVPIPPPAEQLRIVAKIEELFSELDKGVESLTTAREQLKVYRQAVLKHAFEGKLTAEWREQNFDIRQRAEDRLSRIRGDRQWYFAKALRAWQAELEFWGLSGQIGPKPRKPSQLPDQPELHASELDAGSLIPSDWIWVRLGELFSNSPQNGLYKSATSYGTGTAIIRIDSFYDGAMAKGVELKRLELLPDEVKTFQLKNGDLLVNRVNSIEFLGKCLLVTGLSEATVFESNIMRCSFAETHIDLRYLTTYLASHDGRRRLCRNAKHAVNQASINQSDVAVTPVPLAHLEEQRQVIGVLDQLLSIIDRMSLELESQLARAATLRQSILKKAFSGQLVAQDPNDEPASILLERIKAEKKQHLEKARKTNKAKTQGPAA